VKLIIAALNEGIFRRRRDKKISMEDQNIGHKFLKNIS